MDIAASNENGSASVPVRWPSGRSRFTVPRRPTGPDRRLAWTGTGYCPTLRRIPTTGGWTRQRLAQVRSALLGVTNT